MPHNNNNNGSIISWNSSMINFDCNICRQIIILIREMWRIIILSLFSMLHVAAGFVTSIPSAIGSSFPTLLTMVHSSSTRLQGARERTICIVGGGFGGLYTALRLSDRVDKNTAICLIEPKDRFVFLPLLYELAVRSASLVEVAPKYSDLLLGSKVNLVHGTVSNIDFDNNRCDIEPSSMASSKVASSVNYDQLIIATGNQPRLDIVDGARLFALPFYRLQDADNLLSKLLELKHRAQKSVRVTVMGAGYSGVEIAIHVAQFLGKENCIVTIVDRNDQILPSSPAFNRAVSMKSLLANGVNILCKTSVKLVKQNGLELVNSENETSFLDSDLILFTAGMEQSSFVKGLNIAKDKYGRISVKKSLQSVEYENVFSLGDCCGIEDSSVPSTAQAAIQQAVAVARNVEVAWNNKFSREEKKTPLEDFSYLSLGEMVSLGDTNAAISSLGGYVTIRGPLAAIGRRILYAARMPTTSQSIRAFLTASSSITGKFISKWFGVRDTQFPVSKSQIKME